MKYHKIVEGQFLARPNRFIAEVLLNGEVVKCHVKNTGRCKELLTPNAKVILTDHIDNMGSRKLRYSLIGVYKERKDGLSLINMDSQVPNAVVVEALKESKLILPNMGKLVEIRREVKFGDSRFDIQVIDDQGKIGFVEVKGVTLEHDGIVKFPDAPTERGIKHVKELAKAKEIGYNAYVVFVVQMDQVKYMTPNYDTHPEFGIALAEARAKGVEIIGFQCVVKADTIEFDKYVEVFLKKDIDI